MGICQSAVNKGKTSLKGLVEDEEKFNQYMDTAFDKVDVDKNGYLEKHELTQLIQDLVHKLKKDTNVPEDKVQSALELIDTNKDGKVTKEEFKKTSRAKLLAICSS